MVIAGKIVDQDGQGIPAAVYISDAAGKILNPTNGTNANANGDYSLNYPGNMPAGGVYVTAQFVGTTTKTSLIPNYGSTPPNARLDVKLVNDASLPEVVVTANKIKKPNVIVYVLIFTGIAAAAFGIYYYTTHHAHKVVTT